MDGRVREAIAAVHAPMTPAEERAAATVFLEKVKARAEDILPGLLDLARTGSTDGERHFALHAILSLVVERWLTLSAEHQAHLKALAMDIFRSVCVAIEPPFVDAAAVHLVCELAFREWPQRWPSLSADLLAMSAEGPRPATLVLTFFCTLFDEVRHQGSAKLSEGRHQDLAKAIEAVSPEVADFAQRAAVHAGWSMRDDRAGEPGMGPLLGAALGALVATMDVLPTDLSARLRPGEVAALALTAMPSRAAPCRGGDPRLVACDLLAAAVSPRLAVQRGSPQADESTLATANAVVDMLRSSGMAESLSRALDPAEFTVHKRLAEAVAAVCTTVLALYHAKVRDGHGAPNAAAAARLLATVAMLTDLAEEFTRHPSPEVAGPMHGYWVALLRSAQAGDAGPPLQLQGRLGALFLLAVNKLSVPGPGDSAGWEASEAAAYFEVDSADKATASAAMSRQRTSVLAWVAAAAASSRLSQGAVACALRLGADAISAPGGTETRTAVAAWTVVEAVLREARRNGVASRIAAALARQPAARPASLEAQAQQPLREATQDDQAAAAALRHCEAVVLTWDPGPLPERRSLKARALGAMAIAWAAGCDAELVVTSAGQLASLALGHGAAADAAAEKQAALALCAMLRDCSAALGAGPASRAISTALAEGLGRRVVGPGVERALAEALALVAAALGPGADRDALDAVAFASVDAVLDSAEAQRAAAGAEGILSLALACEQAAADGRGRLVHALHMSAVLARHLGHAPAGGLERRMQHLAILAVGVVQSVDAVCALDQPIAGAVVDAMHRSAGDHQRQDPAATMSAEDWLVACRRESLFLLSAATSSGAMYSGDMASPASALAERVVTALHRLPTLAATQVLHTVRSVLARCPESAAGVHRALARAVAEAGEDRLRREWAEVNRAAATPGPAAAEVELARERSCRQVTRDILECLQAALAGPSEANHGRGSGSGPLVVGQLGGRVLADAACAGCVLRLVSSTLTVCRDAPALRQAQACATAAIPVVVSNPDHRRALVGDVVPGAISALTWGSAPVAELVALVREVHMALLDTPENPRYVLLQLPGVSAEALADVERLLRSGGSDHKAPHRAHKAYRDLLAGVITVGAEAQPAGDKVPSLTETLSFASPTKSARAGSSAEADGISAAIEADGLSAIFDEAAGAP